VLSRPGQLAAEAGVDDELLSLEPLEDFSDDEDDEDDESDDFSLLTEEFLPDSRLSVR